jgi:hypothetical protein
MQEKVRLVTLKVINVEDTNIDVKYFKKMWKGWQKADTEGLLLEINAKGWTSTSVCLTELQEIIVDSEWRLLNCYNEYAGATWNKTAFTKDKNETDREKKLLAALVEVYNLGADVKVKF